MQLELDQTNVYYEQHGDHGPQVLLLHGWMCDTTLFAPITQCLSKDMRVTVIDFPAHGKSTRPPSNWGVPEYANMVKQLMKKLNIAPCHIIAHSFGGRVALYIASTEPELIRKMVVTGGAGLKKPVSKEQKKKADQFQRLKKAAQFIQKTHLFGAAPEKLQAMLRKKYGSSDYNALDEDMRKIFVNVISLDLRPALPKVQAPTLLVWGENDTETPLWMGEVMAKEIPDGGLVTFENGTHFAYLEQWQRFCTIAQHFFLEE